MKHELPSQFELRKECFGLWLLAQIKREDAVGQLARDAFADPGFPRDGDVRTISKRLDTVGAPPEMHEALEEAEIDWLVL